MESVRPPNDGGDSGGQRRLRRRVRDSAPKETHVTGLGDLPSEIRIHIVGFLERPRDVVACLLASSLLALRSPIHAAIHWRANGRHERLLESGAPLCTVKRLFTEWGEPCKVRSLLRAAVRGGRPDVVRWTRDVADDGDHQRACLYDDLIVSIDDAASHQRVDVLRYLVHTYNGQGWSWNRDHAPRLAIEAAHRGHTAVLAYIHDRLSDECMSGACQCPRGASDAALAAGHSHVIAWMHAVGCSALPDVCPTSMGEAIVDGHYETARWLTAVMPRSMYRGAIACALVSVHDDLAHVSPLSQISDRGDPLRETILLAVRHGHLDLLKWIVAYAPLVDKDAYDNDDNGDDDGGSDPDDARKETAPESDSLSLYAGAIAHEAATEGQWEIIEWLLAHPQTRCSVSEDTARAAMHAGYVDVALALDRAGVVAMDSWDSLSAAVRSCSERAMHLTSVHGGAYGPHVLAVAVECATPAIVEFLCLRYGAAVDAQTAVDAAAFHPHNPDTIAYLRANVDNLCVARVQAAAAADPEAPRSGWGEPCSCTRCSLS